MMNKKRLLLFAGSFAALAALYAFSYPATVREQVWTIFFPNEAPGFAQEVAPYNGRLSAMKSRLDTLDPLEDRHGDFLTDPNNNIIDLKDPSVVEKKVEYDPESGLYIISEKIGDEFFRTPTYMTFDEYVKWRDQEQQRNYFDRLEGVADGSKKSGGLVDPISKFNIKTSLIERLFGGTEVDIKPQGSINLTFGLKHQNIENPILPIRNQRTTNFDFDMDINMSAQGKIGEKLDLNFNYNTRATFDFDNQMKLKYNPKTYSEDEILQNIEAGNISMPLRSTLIKGAQNLFGIKAELKFGHLTTTLIASQQRSRQQGLTLQGGAQVQTFQVPIDEYDENRHFFISQWNRNQFEPAMKCMPVPLSQFNITRMEVWITNDRRQAPGTNQASVRQVVALADLAEPEPLLDGTNPINSNDPNFPDLRLADPPYKDFLNKPLPENRNNKLYNQLLALGNQTRTQSGVVPALQALGLQQIRDYETVEAISLNAGVDYTYNEQLGFLSINRNVQPDQVIGVALEYTYNGVPYKIGELGFDVPPGDSINQNVLFLKMLKGTTANVKYPIWDLMMKNVYAVGAVNVDPQEFRFDIFYEDPGKGQKRFLDNPAFAGESIRSKPLIQLFNLDNLNLQNDPGPDGIFDFVPGLTINLRSGRVMFPVLEPFGNYLKNKLQEADPTLSDSILYKKIVYAQLYDSTLFRAREFQQLNRFMLRGSYKSSSASEISLGTFNLPPGSVRVSGGGRTLVEGQDYTIDYNIGKVRILNEAILQSGQAVHVSFEDNTLFGFNARTMLGARFDYKFSQNLTVGGTFMNLFERPLTQKVNFGDDPINNKVYGLDFNYTKEAPWLTRALDRLPLYSTKAPSSITAAGEVAYLQPGFNKAINQGKEKGGTVYIDDFEGSTSNLPLSFPANSWMIASVPQGDSTLFPENKAGGSHGPDSLALGANRAKMAWYIADPSSINSGAGDNTNPYTRLFRYQDIFPNRQLSPLEQSTLRPLDVTIYPRLRGPYNFEIPSGYPGISKGLTAGGELVDPKTRWAGFMRGLNNSSNDFEANNIEFIEFWMMNPYMDKPEGVSDAGEMVIDLGYISEDVLRDSRQFFESALPTGTNHSVTVPTPWGRVPALKALVPAFDNNPENRLLQDVGLDGLKDPEEAVFFKSWLNVINNDPLLAPNVKAEWAKDPSGDDFVHYRDARFTSESGVLLRYNNFNNSEGNTPTGTNNDYVTSSTNYPDAEDMNNDNSLNQNESYFRYKIPLAKTNSASSPELDLSATNGGVLGELVTDTIHVGNTIWYRFKVPLDWSKRKSIGGIQDFRSIQFVRMLWRNFTEQTTFRFATLEMGRNQWRRYRQIVSDDPNGAKCPDGIVNSAFDINSVSIEENAARTPFNYTIPPGIQRENSVGAFPDILQNEQALSLSVCNLPYCQGRAIFKTLNMDLRRFDKLKMFAHAEPATDDPQDQFGPNDVKIFIRIGSDFSNNYYEYEIPLVASDKSKIQGFFSTDDEYKAEVWKNIFDFPLESLTELKRRRNNLGADAGKVYIEPDPDNAANNIKIIGNPNLGYVKGIMIGVANKDTFNTQCLDIWVNELRLNGFSNRGGYAGTARVDIKLADLGNLSAAGTFTSRGWGGIDQKLLARQLEDVMQFDVSTNLALDKFLPEKWGLRLPFYAQYSNLTRRPEYDPYDLDVKLSDKLSDLSTKQERDSVKFIANDVTTTRGYNFTNVRKERKGSPRKVPLPWNIENFSLTYAYNEQNRRTPYIISDNLRTYKGGLDYQYATGLQPWQPFKKSKLSDKYFKAIKDFNFNPLPETYGFNTNLQRIAQTTVWRPFTPNESLASNTYYNRRFTWDRNYDLSWTIAKSLRFNFDANARSLIDEPLQNKPDGSVYTRTERRDSILTNMRSLGRPKNYTQTGALNYTFPFKSIRMLDWVTAKASYTTTYTWSAQSLKLQNLDAGQYNEVVNSRNLGNVIQNNTVRQINGDFNFEGLYNKSKYLAKINKPSTPGNGKPGKNDPGNKNDNNGNGGDGGGKAPGRGGKGNNNGGGMDDGGGKAPGGKGNAPGAAGGNMSGGDMSGGKSKGSPSAPTPPNNTPPTKRGDPGAAGGNAGNAGGMAGGNNNGGAPGPKVDKNGVPIPGSGGDNGDAGDDKSGDGKGGGKGNAGSGSNGKDKKDEKKKDRQPTMAERIALRPLMLIRKARFTYSENIGSVVPGFTPETKLLGLSEGFMAPGWDYIVGGQPSAEWLDAAGQKGWITNRAELNQQVTRNYTQNLDAGVSIEPFRDFKVEINASRQYTRNSTELFKDQNLDLNPQEVNFEHRAQRDMGSYTTSFFALNTLFEKDIDGLFKRFQAYGPIVSQRLGVAVGDITPHQDQVHNPGYVNGYGKIQQQVLIPAFMAAYTGKDPNTIGLNIFNTRPALNWKLNYNGLSKVGKMSKIFASIQISHGYKSTLTVNSYNTDIFYDAAKPLEITDQVNLNYTARLEIPQISITEQFQPLIGIEAKTKGGMSVRFDYKKSRTLGMSFTDYNLNEANRTSYSFGFGHRIKDVDIPFLTGSKKAKGSSSKKSASAKKKKGKAAPAPPPPPGGGSGASQAHDLNIKFDFEYNDDVTVVHSLQRDEAQPSRGSTTISINPSIDYQLNRRLAIRLFTDYRRTIPKTSQSFPLTTINGGITVQFKLN